MSVKVSKKMIDVFGGRGISIPFSNIKSKKGFIGVSFRGSDEFSKVSGQVFDEVLVKILSKQVGYAMLARDSELTRVQLYLLDVPPQ
jgi:hypothetical protein